MSIVKQLDVLEFLAEDAQAEVTRLSRKVYDGVTLRTAVRTGQTVASWNVSKNSPNYKTVDTGLGLVAKQFPVLSFTQREFPKVFVANGKHHAQYLEEGTAKMAPRAMIAPTLAGI